MLVAADLAPRPTGACFSWPADGKAHRLARAYHGGTGAPYRTAAECIDWSIPLSIFPRSTACRGHMQAHRGRAAPFVVESPRPIIAPPGAAVGSADHPDLVAVWLAKHYGGVVGRRLERPIGTITAVDHHGLVACYIRRATGQSVGQSLDAPAPTHSSCNQRARGRLLTNIMGGHRQSLDEPMHTVVSRDRFGLVTVPDRRGDLRHRRTSGSDATPRELARAQGFTDDPSTRRHADRSGCNRKQRVPSACSRAGGRQRLTLSRAQGTVTTRNARPAR